MATRPYPTGSYPMSTSTYSDSSSESEGSGFDGGDSASASDDSEPEVVRNTHRSHRLKFKCIGSKEEQRYQDALRSAQDVRRLGTTWTYHACLIIERTSEP